MKYECSRDNGGGLNRQYVFLASIKRNRDGHFGIGWSDKYMHRCVCVLDRCVRAQVSFTLMGLEVRLERRRFQILTAE